MERVCAACNHNEAAEFPTHYRCIECGHRMEKGYIPPKLRGATGSSTFHDARKPSLPKLKFLENKD